MIYLGGGNLAARTVRPTKNLIWKDQMAKMADLTLGWSNFSDQIVPKEQLWNLDLPF